MYRIIGADQKEYGPISPEQLRQWVTEGRVNAQTKVLAEGSVDWKPLEALPEFSILLGLQPPPVGLAPIQPLPAPPPRTNPHAMTGMIMGLLSITCGLCCCYGLPFNLLGIIFSLVGLSQIKGNPELYSGKGLAITGLVTSLVSIALAGLMIILGLLFGWGDMMMRDLRKF
jgi:hypothetical protein